jgi:hypothetical protein
LKINVKESEGAIDNGQSRETCNIGQARHRTKTNKTKTATQKSKMMNTTDPTITGVECFLCTLS